MKRLNPVARGLLVLVLLTLAPPADAKAPGKRDPAKLADKVTKHLEERRWDAAAAACVDGLALVVRDGAWDRAHGEELGVETRLLWEKTARGAIEAMVEYGDEERDRVAQRAGLTVVDAYLERWPDHTHSYAMTHRQGQLAYAVKEYRASAEAYQRLYRMNPETGRLRHEAAAGWIAALWLDGGDNWEFFDGQADLVQRERLDLTDDIARHQPIELAEAEHELIAAMDAFVAAVPDHDYAPELLYRAIWLHHDRCQPDGGIQRAIAFVQGYDDSPRHAQVARMLVDLARWSERDNETRLRVVAMGLDWDELVALAGEAGEAPPPPPWEPDRLKLFPRQQR